MKFYLPVLVFIPFVTSLKIKCYEGLDWSESNEKPQLVECDVTKLCLFANATLEGVDAVNSKKVTLEIPMVGKCTTIDQCTNLDQLQVSDVASEMSSQFKIYFHIAAYSVKEQHFQCCFHDYCNSIENITKEAILPQIPTNPPKPVVTTTLKHEPTSSTEYEVETAASEYEAEVTTKSSAACLNILNNTLLFITFYSTFLVYFAWSCFICNENF